jgi:transcriptional regulator with XRE-family HTH domain
VRSGPHPIPRTNIERTAARRARELRTRLGADLRTAREDAGLSLTGLARTCGIAKSTLHAIESGQAEPRLETAARLATALGSDLGLRLYPGTGPLVRDHLQLAMLEALLSVVHPRWRARPEVPVYQPVRGVIDLVLEDALYVVACEAQSELRRLEQQLRWSRSKAEALDTLRKRAGPGQLAGQPAWPDGPQVGRLMLLRSTARTRAVVSGYAQVVAAAYPARASDAYAALVGLAPWPGDALVWCRVEGDEAVMLDRPPRGVHVGR